MRRLALLGLLLVAGCLPRAEVPRGVVNVVFADAREARVDEFQDMLAWLYAYIPLVPWTSRGVSYFPRHSLLPELRRALEASNLFESVVGPGDPWAAREAADHELQIELRETSHSRVSTAYGLSLAGFLLQALGAPSEYDTTYVELQATCRDREGKVLASGVGDEREFSFGWIYEGSRSDGAREDLEECVRAALSEALEPLFD